MNNNSIIRRAEEKLRDYLIISGLEYVQIDKVDDNCFNFDMSSKNPNKLSLLCTNFLLYENLLERHSYAFGVGIEMETFDNLYFLSKNEKNEIHIMQECTGLTNYLDKPNSYSNLATNKIVENYFLYIENLQEQEKNLDNLIEKYLKND